MHEHSHCKLNCLLARHDDYDNFYLERKKNKKEKRKEKRNLLTIFHEICIIKFKHLSFLVDLLRVKLNLTTIERCCIYNKFVEC